MVSLFFSIYFVTASSVTFNERATTSTTGIFTKNRQNLLVWGFIVVLFFSFFLPYLVCTIHSGKGRRRWELMRSWRDSVKSEGSGVATCGHALVVPLMGAPPESKTMTGPVIWTCSSVAALFAVATETSMSFVGWYRGFALSSEYVQSSPPLLDMGQAEHRWDLFPGWQCPFPSLFRDSVQAGSKPYLASVILELLWPLEKKMSVWEEKGLNF